MSGTTENPGQPMPPESPSWETLVGIALDALRISPPLYASSIFGLPWTWLPPFNRYSEFKIIDLWRPGRTAKFLANTWIPSIPRTPPILRPAFPERSVLAAHRHPAAAGSQRQLHHLPGRSLVLRQRHHDE